MNTSKENISKSPSGRPSRTPISQRNVLTVTGKDPNYEYRIVNDRGDRVTMFEEAGYEIEKADKVRVGDKRVNKASPEGTLAQVAVGNGEKAYVMKIQKELYEADQADKRNRIHELEKTITQSVSGENKYGKIDISR